MIGFGVLAGSWEAEEARARAGFRLTQRSVLAVVATPEAEVLPTVEELDIGYVPNSPLAKGLPHREDRRAHHLRQRRHPHHDPSLHAKARQANQALVELLGMIAERKQATPAQIALAWLLAQKPWIVPIPGTRRLERLEENIGAVDIELTADDLREIEDTASQITVQGARYPEHLERLTGR
jgi:aryl-alcohol dehydrogenase-like predicted oxidoreductase